LTHTPVAEGHEPVSYCPAPCARRHPAQPHRRRPTIMYEGISARDSFPRSIDPCTKRATTTYYHYHYHAGEASLFPTLAFPASFVFASEPQPIAPGEKGSLICWHLYTCAFWERYPKELLRWTRGIYRKSVVGIYEVLIW
jgi:hypothetical protein